MYLTQGLHRAMQQKQNETATVFGGRRRTFGEYGQRVARLAGALQQLGMQPGDRIGMLSLNSDRYLEYYMGVFWGGGVVNPCNIRWSAAEIAYSLDDCGTAILIVDDMFKPMVEELKKKSKLLRTVIYAGDGETPAGMLSFDEMLANATPVDDAGRSGDDLAGVFYTGGTTGFPKGVMLTHANLFCSSLSLVAEEIPPDGAVYLHAAPMFHLADLAFGLSQFIRGGAHVVIPAFTPAGLLEAIEASKVTHTLLVPTMIQMTADYPMLKDHDVSSLQAIAYGASPISEAVLERAFVAFPEVAFTQAYGMTELSPLATILPAYYHTAEGRKAGKLRAAGRASYCTEVKIVDENGMEVPRGTVGEIAVRSPGVMKGYWNKPEQTAAAVRAGWMHTGDGAYMDQDGFIFIVDRLKDMIVSGGENVYSAEVENAIAQHPAVAVCAVIGIPSEQWGESVHAVVILKPDLKASGEDIMAHCAQLIAGYKCPRSIEFCDALPLSGAGKILKMVLREPFWRGKSRQVG